MIGCYHGNDRVGQVTPIGINRWDVHIIKQ